MLESFTPEPWLFMVLPLVALAAGFVDSIAGGGGLLMMPSLLAAGLPPHFALGTNKLQSSWGTMMACRTYWKGGLVHIRGNFPLVMIAFTGAVCGSFAVQQISAQALDYIVPVCLIGVVIYTFFSRRMTDDDAHHILTRRGYAPVAGGIGFYDGFFGPGTGQFFTASLVALRGYGLTRAAANCKLFNLTTNIAALMTFALGGKVLWLLGLCMAVGSMTGG
ncbi:MAG: TSUP family transporter, partial [Sphingomonadaceae bacterium]